MNLVPPTITSCEATNQNDKLKLSWKQYDFENWSGGKLGYMIYWKKVTDVHDEEAIDITDYQSFNFTTPALLTLDEVLQNDRPSEEHTIIDLDVFTEYSVLLSANNELGEGSHQKTSGRTGPGRMTFIFFFSCYNF